MAEASEAPVSISLPNFGPGLFVGLACLMDILLLRSWLLGQLAIIEVVTLHSLLAIALGAISCLVCRRVSHFVLAGVGLLLLFGPLGGPALMIVGPSATSARPRNLVTTKRALSAATPTSRTEELYNQINQGRRHPLAQEPLCGFLETFKSGTLHQQQEAIAAISRRYHPDMRPALSAALASPIPALRVQAAAVYAKLRGTFEGRAKELLALGKTDIPQSARRDLSEECLAVAQSGFVDSEKRELLREFASSLSVPVQPSSPSLIRIPLEARLQSALQPAPRLKRYACGGLG